MLESALTKKIKKQLEETVGGWWKKIHGSIYSRGMPDLIGCLNGTFIGLEIKRPDNKRGVTDSQLITLDQISKAGKGLVGVVTSFVEVIDLIDGILDKTQKRKVSESLSKGKIKESKPPREIKKTHSKKKKSRERKLSLSLGEDTPPLTEEQISGVRKIRRLKNKLGEEVEDGKKSRVRLRNPS